MSNEKPRAPENKLEKQEGMRVLDTPEKLQMEVNNYAKAFVASQEIKQRIKKLQPADTEKTLTTDPKNPLADLKKTDLAYQQSLLSKLEAILVPLKELIIANIALDIRGKKIVDGEIENKFNKMVDLSILKQERKAKQPFSFDPENPDEVQLPEEDEEDVDEEDEEEKEDEG